MKLSLCRWFRAGNVAAVLLCGLANAPGGLIFTDAFDPGPSPLWGDESGSWQASAGAYYATQPNNQPNAYSSLPFNLADFSLDFDINNVSDGGVFLRVAPVPGSPNGIKGVLLNFKVPLGGSRIYWHVFYDGTNATPALNLVNVDFGTSPHVHVEVWGDTYSAFINGSTLPITTLTTNVFSTGRVALYDFSSQTFGNVALSIVDPQLFIRMEADGAVLYWSTNFSNYTLQTTADLSQPAGWLSFGGPYVVQNGFYELRLPMLNLLRRQFFRLRATWP